MTHVKRTHNCVYSSDTPLAWTAKKKVNLAGHPVGFPRLFLNSVVENIAEGWAFVVVRAAHSRTISCCVNELYRQFPYHLARSELQDGCLTRCTSWARSERDPVAAAVLATCHSGIDSSPQGGAIPAALREV